jgi:16S rRNA processing protein RimM
MRRPSTRPKVTTSSDLNGGRIVGVFGLRGECKIDATRLGADALAVGSVVRVRLADGSERDLRVRAARMHKGRPLATFEGFDDVNAAEALVGATLALDRADVVLSPGEYLDADLVGCVLVGLDDAPLGSVVAVEHYPSQDMLVVGAARALVPLVAAFVKSIDIAAKRIVVDLPRGLLDDREAEADCG